MAHALDDLYDRPARAERGNAAATASLTLGLMSLLLSVLTGIPAVIAGIVGLARARSRGAGRGKSVAGILLGLASVAVLVAVVALVVPAWTTVQSVREMQEQGLPAADSPQAQQGKVEVEKAFEQLGVDPSSLTCDEPRLSGTKAGLSCTGTTLDGQPATVEGTCPAVQLLRGKATCEGTVNGDPASVRVTLEDGVPSAEVLSGP